MSSILTWNYRGLGHRRAVPTLKDSVWSHKSEVVFLCETLAIGNKIEEVRVKLGYAGAFKVDRVGWSGGVALLWNKPLEYSVLSFSNNHIDVEVHTEGGVNWRLTGYYGRPERNRRKEGWDLLRCLSYRSRLPWCIVGDFNDLLTSDEKLGGLDYLSWLLAGSRSAIMDCGLRDIALEGHQFTWSRGKGNGDMIEEHLDRAMMIKAWVDNFPTSKLINLIAATSDHSPLLLMLEAKEVFKHQRQFRFKNSWLLELDVKEVVTRGWPRGANDDLVSKMRKCSKKLERWRTERSPKLRIQIERCKKQMEKIRSCREVEAVKAFHVLRGKLNHLLLQEVAFWLQGGHMNTRYFRAQASVKRKRNTIKSLQREDGSTVYSQEELKETIVQYFQQLFTGRHGDYDPVIDVMEEKILEDNNGNLTRPFTKEEFRSTVAEMHKDKSSSPDGLNPAFFCGFWDICGNDVYKSCCEWLNMGTMPRALNSTNIALIPKCEAPRNMKDLRSISLCNVAYKILSKALANRLKGVLDKCISEEQAAFVANRSITDNVLVAVEVLHHLNCKTKGLQGEVALKIDFSKAYDRVDWGFVIAIMKKMGFASQWLEWINMCLTSVSYHVCINGELAGPTKSRA